MINKREILDTGDGLMELSLCCERARAVCAELLDYFGYNDPAPAELKDAYPRATAFAGIAFDYIIEMQRIIKALEESIS